MGLVDYNYYKDTYNGISITSEDMFVKHEGNAERLLSSLIPNGSLSVIPNINGCICEMADASFLYQNINGIASESVGGHSVTYTTSHNVNKVMYDIAFSYIADYMNRRIDIVY